MVGYIYIDGTQSHGPGIRGRVPIVSRMGQNNSLGPSSLQIPSPCSGSGSLSLVASTAINNSSRVTDPSYKALVDFDGSRLTEYGVFITIYGGIVSVAGFDRSQPITRRFTLSDPQSSTLLEIKSWIFPYRSESPLDDQAAIYMLSRVPSYMYRQSSFRECTFLVERDGSPVGARSSRKGTDTSSVAVAR